MSIASKRHYDDLSFFGPHYLALLASTGLTLSVLCSYFVTWIVIGRTLNNKAISADEFYELSYLQKTKLLKII